MYCLSINLQAFSFACTDSLNLFLDLAKIFRGYFVCEQRVRGYCSDLLLTFSYEELLLDFQII